MGGNTHPAGGPSTRSWRGPGRAGSLSEPSSAIHALAGETGDASGGCTAASGAKANLRRMAHTGWRFELLWELTRTAATGHKQGPGSQPPRTLGPPSALHAPGKAGHASRCSQRRHSSAPAAPSFMSQSRPWLLKSPRQEVSPGPSAQNTGHWAADRGSPSGKGSMEGGVVQPQLRHLTTPP